MNNKWLKLINKRKSLVEYIFRYYEDKRPFVFSDMAISPDGNYLAVTKDVPGDVRLFLFDTRNNEQILSLKLNDPMRLVSFSPDGKHFLYPQKGKLVIRNLYGEIVNEIYICPTHYRIAWHPSGKYLVQVSNNVFFDLINVEDGELELRYEYSPSLYADNEYDEEAIIHWCLSTVDAAWYPNGKRLLVLVGNKLVLHEFPRFRILKVADVASSTNYYDSIGKRIVISKGAKYIGILSGDLEVFDGETLEIIEEYCNNGVYNSLFFDWSPDSRYGVYGRAVLEGNSDSPKGVVRLWDFKEGIVVATWALDDEPIRGYFHPTRKQIYVLLSRNGLVSLYY